MPTRFCGPRHAVNLVRLTNTTATACAGRTATVTLNAIHALRRAGDGSDLSHGVTAPPLLRARSAAVPWAGTRLRPVRLPPARTAARPSAGQQRHPGHRTCRPGATGCRVVCALQARSPRAVPTQPPRAADTRPASARSPRERHIRASASSTCSRSDTTGEVWTDATTIRARLRRAHRRSATPSDTTHCGGRVDHVPQRGGSSSRGEASPSAGEVLMHPCA